MWRDARVIVTGGSSGIGLELARRLCAKGANIALLARDPDRLGKARNDVKACGKDKNRVEVYSCDVTSMERAEAAVSAITREMGSPDVLINSAGVLSGGYFEELPIEDFRTLMETNFFGALYMIKAALPLIKKKRGRIVNVASIAGAMGVFGYTSYCASKYALAGFTEALRSEMKPQGVRVHLVLPPQTHTPMLENVEKVRPPENMKLAATMATLTVEKTADAILKGVEKGKYLIVPGWQTAFFMRLGQVFPGLARMVVDMTVKGCYVGPGGKKG